MRSFIDTNVLIYADAGDEPAKQSVAIALIAQCLRDGSGVISTQVLHEFINAALRKLNLPLATVRERLRVYARFETIGSSTAAALEALELHATHRISFWDALILQAARQSGCVRLLSEDLQTGASIAGVRIVNPFLPPARGQG
ncbi:MAG: PIN domain-containing protein [Rubrivivax sp.]